MSGFGTVDGGVPFPESLADMPIIVDLKLPEFGPELMLPHGFEWDAWNPAIVCCDCGIVFSALAPTVDMEQRAYDEMAVEHRRRCPGDGA